MPITPIITFKAGLCDIDIRSSPKKVTPQPESGYIYLYEDDDLLHFCWRQRFQPPDAPELDLVMVPTDGSFIPYEYTTTPQPTSKTNGRVFVLKFASSSQRHLFWMQSKPQGRNGDPSYFSPRDRKIGEIVNRLLQAEEFDVTRELESVLHHDAGGQDDEDENMEDAEGQSGQRDDRAGGSGGAGADATGGDVREEGSGSREGGADGARAASSSTPDTSAVVRNFLDSLKGQAGLAGGQQQQQHADIPYPHLNHLLPTPITVPMIDTISAKHADRLLGFLPPTVIVLASNSSDLDGKTEPTGEQVKAAMASLSLEDKRRLLKKVLRSPQFHQALGTLTMAIRDGGLPSIADALKVSVENGGYLQGGMPMGGGYAVQAFVEGVKKTVQEKKQ